MEKATALLLAKAAEMGILCTPGQMPAGVCVRACVGVGMGVCVVCVQVQRSCCMDFAGQEDSWLK